MSNTSRYKLQVDPPEKINTRMQSLGVSLATMSRLGYQEPSSESDAEKKEKHKTIILVFG